MHLCQDEIIAILSICPFLAVFWHKVQQYTSVLLDKLEALLNKFIQPKNMEPSPLEGEENIFAEWDQKFRVECCPEERSYHCSGCRNMLTLSESRQSSYCSSECYYNTKVLIPLEPVSLSE